MDATVNQPDPFSDEGPTYDPYAAYRDRKPVQRQHRLEPRTQYPGDGTVPPQQYPTQQYPTRLTPQPPLPQPSEAELEEQARRRAWEESVRQQALQWAEEQARQKYAQQHYAPPPPYYAPVQQVTVNNNVRAGGGCPHMLHFVLTVLTCGMWLPIWIIHAIVDAFRS